MGLTTGSWSRPIQGISQQPPKVRIRGQATKQVNAVSSVVNGLVKRPGTVYQNILSGTPIPKESQWSYYNRGTGERYFICIPPNTVNPRIWDSDGVELTLENELSDNSYLISGAPNESISITTISDFTFIANNEVVPKKTAAKSPAASSTAIINMQFADYGREYVIYLDGAEAAFLRTPDGADAEQVRYVDTTYVANVLETGSDNIEGGTSPIGPDNSGFEIRGGLNKKSGYTVERVANVITLYKDDGSPFTIKTADGADGKNLIAIQGQVKSVSDLPRYAPEGYVVEVVGAGNTDDDNYFLKARPASADTVEWVETMRPEVSKGFDRSTMPVTLIRDRFESGRAVFKLKEGKWAEREVGDDDSNPLPSFVQDAVPINSVGTLQNRLYFTAGESVIYSRSNDFFSFFKETVRSDTDADPVDVYADTNQINVLQSSITLDGDAVFFSPNGQFVQSGDKPITKENAVLEFASTFESTQNVRPVAGGDVIFFPFDYGRFTGIREFYTDNYTDTKKARPVTDHVDEYIKGSARLLATSTNRNQLLVLAEPENKLFVYNYLWQANERVQSSWSEWVFDAKILYVYYDDDLILLVFERNGKVTLEYIESGDPSYSGYGLPVRLDRAFTRTPTESSGEYKFTMPYKPNTDNLIIVQGTGCLDAGVTVNGSYDASSNEVTITDDIGTGTLEVVVGERYEMRYQPTMPFIKDKSGAVIGTDRLMVNDVYLNYDLTGLTYILVENEWGGVREYSFNGRVLGQANNVVGFAKPEAGNHKFPLRQQSDRVTFTISTWSHLPFQLRDMEWRGRFNQRGRRV